jgi:hypothetical protein
VKRVWRRVLLVLLAAAWCAASAPSPQAAEAPAKKSAPKKSTSSKKKKSSAAAKPAADVPTTPGVHGADVQASFNEFCEVWMGKLVQREIFNKQQIKWRPSAAGVEGEYVGYSTEHTCDLRPPIPGGPPIGKVIYRELIYRKKGNSKEEAQVSEPEIVEVTEITEIFRREKGKWIY